MAFLTFNVSKATLLKYGPGRDEPDYRPGSYLRADSVAVAVLHAATAPADAAITELVLRPAG